MTDTFSFHKKIDMHSHVGQWAAPFNYESDADAIIKNMNTYNIEKTLICSSTSYNTEETLAAYKKYPDKLVPIARLDCSKGAEAYDMFEHCIRDLGFKGGKIQSLFDGYTADAPCVDPAVEICEQYNVPFFVHSGHEPFSLPWQIGLLAERHPNCKFVMLHMGHGHGVYVEAALNMARRYDNIWLETSGTSMTAQIQNAYCSVDKSRVMFGLDSPFHAPQVEIQKILSCDIGEDDYNNIFYNNAKLFMGNLLD